MDGSANKKNRQMKVAVLGLGEAGSLFANNLAEKGVEVTGWDPSPQRRLHKTVILAESNAAAVKSADIILSVNLSAVSEDVAREVMPVLNSKMIYAEMNTSSPQQKITIDNFLKPTGVKFADVAIMAPVPPNGIETPFLLSGGGAAMLEKFLSPYNPNMSVLSDKTGDASTHKLLRSIVYKGVAAVICEAMEAAKAFELEDYMRQQISSVIGGNDGLIDRFIEGSYAHAERRIHEMEAVVAMLADKNINPFMVKAAKENLTKIKQGKNYSFRK
jgi:3-hydroxyisobutyrate dehydrogenase-like beta-hydroxyacid dehydrogenase